MSATVPFKDVHAYSSGGGYTAPNEAPLVWRELLKGIPVYKAAGICSAGEVGLFGILPLVRENLYLVDHSYHSLSVALAKYLLLREHGPEVARDLLTATSQEKLLSTLDGLKERLPAKVKPNSRHFQSYDRATLRWLWNSTPKKILQKSYSKLDKVQFIHGDLIDLAEYGPFGVLYLSNALSHYSRTGKHPIVAEVEKLVKPGGYVVACGSDAYTVDGTSFGRYEHLSKRWELLKTERFVKDGKQHQYEYGWSYHLYRVPKERVH